MQHSLLKIEMLKEGRSIRLPILLIFYNSILAFVTILFIFFNNESLHAGYYSGQSSYLLQFLIISSIQILSIFFMMPFTVSAINDSEKQIAKQFIMIPGVVRYHILAKIHLLVVVNLLLFISSLPIISISCIYSGVSLIKLFRLFLIICFLSFWSGSLALFFYSICSRQLIAFAGSFFSYIMFAIGIILFLEVVKGGSMSVSSVEMIPQEIRFLCLIMNLFNPLTVYVGYLENFTGNIPMITSYFSSYGIDVTSTAFSFLYFKAAILVSCLVSVFFLYLSVRFFNLHSREFE